MATLSKSKIKFSWRQAALVAIPLAVIGLVVVFSIFAAGTPTAFEAESGSIAGAATVSVAGQSGSGAVKFGLASIAACPTGWPVCPAVPAGVPTVRTGCAAAPSACGFADDTNTGILPGVTLTKVPSEAKSGPGWACDTTGPGIWGSAGAGGHPPTNSTAYGCATVIISGNVGTATTGLELAEGITADVVTTGVTVKNLKLDGPYDRANLNGDNQSGEAIAISGTSSGVVIDHCEISAPPSSMRVMGPNDAPGHPTNSPQRIWSPVDFLPGATSVTVQYCKIAGASGGTGTWQEKGTNRFIGNYIHDVLCWNYNTGGACGTGAGGDDHCNLIASGGGPSDLTSTFLAMHNTLLGDNPTCMSTTISMFPDGSAQTNQHTMIYHNLISGGGYYCINPGLGDAFGAEKFTYFASMYNDWIPASNGSGGYTGCGSGGTFYGGFPSETQRTPSAHDSFQCGDYWDAGYAAGKNGDYLPDSGWYPAASTNVGPPTSCASMFSSG